MPLTWDSTAPADADMQSDFPTLHQTDKSTISTVMQEEHDWDDSDVHARHLASAARIASYAYANIPASPLDGLCVWDNENYQLYRGCPNAYSGLSATFTNGVATVTGTLTSWLTYLRPGDIISLDADGTWYRILSVDLDTQVTLTENYADAGGSGDFSTYSKVHPEVRDNLGQSIFGDGSDGDVTISANTAVTADKQYKNLTIDPTVTLTFGSASYVIFLRVRETLTVNGTITGLKSSTGSGWGGAGGGGGGSGGAGGTAGSGNISGAAPFIAAATQNGLAIGGGGAGGGAGGAGSNGSASNVSATSHSLLPGAFPYMGGSAGGAGGGATAAGNGSVGLIILANSIIVGAGGNINADGSDGTAAVGASNNGGGGGGGGGILLLTYRSLTSGGTIQSAGGTGGAGDGTGAAGGDGGNGLVIYNAV